MGYSFLMTKTTHILIALVFLMPLACTESEDNYPTFPVLLADSEEGDPTDVLSTDDSEVDTSVDTSPELDASESGLDSIEDGISPADSETPEDANGNDGVEPDGLIATEDTGNPKGDAEGEESPGDSTTAVDDGSAGADSASSGDSSEKEDVEEDVEEETSCDVDSDCMFLTPKNCCPWYSPCVVPAEVGTLKDEVEALAWIQTECPLVEDCPQLVSPECSDCFNLYNYAPICDKTLGECSLDVEPNCTDICGAAASVDTCPTISDPDDLTEALVIDCMCP